MAISCDPSALANAARCFDNCIPLGMQPAVQAYIMAVILGKDGDIKSLLKEAKCYQCLDGMQLAVQSYILCYILDLLD